MAKRESGLELCSPMFVEKASHALALFQQYGIPVRLFETIRAPSRQDALYMIGRAKGDPGFGRTVTRAKRYQSAHQYGEAGDFVYYIDGRWIWEPPKSVAQWETVRIVLNQAGLVTLSFEQPHAQTGWFYRETTEGPPNDDEWREWLKKRNK